MMILILSIFSRWKIREYLISKGNQLNDLVVNKVEQVCFIIFVYLFASIAKIKNLQTKLWCYTKAVWLYSWKYGQVNVNKGVMWCDFYNNLMKGDSDDDDNTIIITFLIACRNYCFFLSFRNWSIGKVSKK